MELWLIKDDDSVNDIAKDFAPEAGFKVEEITIARSAQEARTLIQEALENKRPPPSVAVVDPHLTPGMDRLEDGIEVIAKLQEHFPACISICLTTKGNIKLSSRALAAGAKDYIDCDTPYVNWCSLTVQRLELWKGFKEKASC
ncbi:MAG: response regulator [Kiritimatiellales bacterium]|nr:response regulator [Kiritimatiellales bacterium]